MEIAVQLRVKTLVENRLHLRTGLHAALYQMPSKHNRTRRLCHDVQFAGTFSEQRHTLKLLRQHVFRHGDTAQITLRHIRQKLGSDQYLIETVRGVGYKMVMPR